MSSVRGLKLRLFATFLMIGYTVYIRLKINLGILTFLTFFFVSTVLPASKFDSLASPLAGSLFGSVFEF